MKTKQKSPSNTQEPATPSAEQVDSPPEKTPAPPVEPPVRGEDGDLYAHAPHWKIYGYFDKIPPYLLPSDLDVPKIDYIFPPPTPVELLAFATAIHGSGPLPRNRKALEKLFSQAFVLWRESQHQIKAYSRYVLPHQETVPSAHDLEPQNFESFEDFVRHVTGLKRSDDARVAFHKGLDSNESVDSAKKVDDWVREFVNGSNPQFLLARVTKKFKRWYRTYLRTARTNSVVMRGCYALVRKVTGLKNKEKVKALFEEWKKHEATTGHQTGEGAALLERLRERFEPWWKEKQADNANAKDARNLSRRPLKRKSQKSS